MVFGSVLVVGGGAAQAAAVPNVAVAAPVIFGGAQSSVGPRLRLCSSFASADAAAAAAAAAAPLPVSPIGAAVAAPSQPTPVLAGAVRGAAPGSPAPPQRRHSPQNSARGPLRSTALSEPSAETLEAVTVIHGLLVDRQVLKTHVVQCFRKATMNGASRLDIHGVVRFAALLSAAVGVPARIFNGMATEQPRFDFSMTGKLEVNEVYKLTKFHLWEWQKLYSPWTAGVQVPTMSLKEAGYEISVQLGRGSQGQAMLATTSDGSEVCIKRYGKHTMTLEGVQEIKDEFETMRMLPCDRIARAFEIFQDTTYYYMATELCYGGDFTTLKEKAHEQGVETNEAWWRNVFYQCFEALGFMHEQAMMHCDIKEPNLMIKNADMARPQVLLIDFGVSKAMVGGGDGVKGTPGYIPPETWNEGKWFPRGDIFCMGICIVQMMTDKMPPAGARTALTPGGIFIEGCKTIEEMAMATRTRQPPFHLMPRGYPALTAMCKQLLEKRRQYRPSAPQVLACEWFAPRSHQLAARKSRAEARMESGSSAEDAGDNSSPLQRRHLATMGITGSFLARMDDVEDEEDQDLASLKEALLVCAPRNGISGLTQPRTKKATCVAVGENFAGEAPKAAKSRLFVAPANASIDDLSECIRFDARPEEVQKRRRCSQTPLRSATSGAMPSPQASSASRGPRPAVPVSVEAANGVPVGVSRTAAPATAVDAGPRRAHTSSVTDSPHPLGAYRVLAADSSVCGASSGDAASSSTAAARRLVSASPLPVRRALGYPPSASAQPTSPALPRRTPLASGTAAVRTLTLSPGAPVTRPAREAELAPSSSLLVASAIHAAQATLDAAGLGRPAAVGPNVVTYRPSTLTASSATSAVSASVPQRLPPSSLREGAVAGSGSNAVGSAVMRVGSAGPRSSPIGDTVPASAAVAAGPNVRGALSPMRGSTVQAKLCKSPPRAAAPWAWKGGSSDSLEATPVVVQQRRSLISRGSVSYVLR
eukprot:TRINITY_DN7898_c0_g2_i1.p1 TRINITY_DN7898_c0_g2~~TRINITY_DN7898_c0_g2_i1.p1  ORF type:complete len:988 (+),score=252.73 TRINITY_DN7898_c0_g2_i1:136-3099(+)